MEIRIDSLTGLPGREAMDALREKFSVRDEHENWTLMIIDVDNFKMINDIYGHLVGDHVLSAVASQLRENTRQNDSILRYGGDEFLAVLPDTPEREALNYAQRAVKAIRDAGFPHDIKVSVSIGVAESTRHDTTFETLLKRADSALYRAKEDGRDRVYFFHQGAMTQDTRSLAFGHFVGRQKELVNLRRVLDETLAEGVRFALVTGEAGAGKSRLIIELEHYAKFRNCSILRSSCHEFGEVEPYAVFTRPLRECIASLPAAAKQIFLKSYVPIHAATSELFPGFESIAPSRSFLQEESLKFRIYEDVAGILGALATVHPILFILEGLQWMATPDLELLAHLVRSSGESPVMFVATVRTEEEQTVSITDRVREAAGSVPLLKVQLSNLDQTEAKDLTILALHDPAIPQDVLETLYRHSGGNPFFLKELIKALTEDGCIVPQDTGGWEYRISPQLALPDSLGQVISRRLTGLPPPSLKMLRIASLTIDAFSVSLLANVADKTALEVAEALGEPFRMGLIKEDTFIDREPVYRFTNDTVKSYLHDLLPRPMTAIFHTRMAAFFEGLYKKGREDTVAATAYHYCHSADPVKAKEYSLLAAKSAERRRANKETIRWLESYLSLADSNGEDNGGLFQALRLLGELYSLTGDGLKAEATLKRSLDLAVSDEHKTSVLSRLGTNAQTLSMYSQARSYYAKALCLSDNPVIKVNILLSMVYLDDVQGRQTHALPRLEQARELLKTAPENISGLENAWAEYFKRLGDIVSEVKPGTDALKHYEEARARFRRLGDTVGEASTINNMSTEYSIIGDYERSLDLLRQAERINTRLDDALGLTIALYNLAETYGCLNQISMARDYYHRYLALSKRIKNRLGDGYGQLGLGYLNELEGDLVTAEQRYREAAETFDKLDAEGVAFVSHLRLVEVLLASGRLQEAEEVLARLQEGKPKELGPDIESDLLFMSGLVCFEGARGGKTVQAAEAEKLLRRSLAITKTIDLHPLMKRYYYLVLTLHTQGRSNEYRNTLKEAVQLLNERLSFIKTSTIRTGILQIREISHLLNEARECGISQ